MSSRVNAMRGARAPVRLLGTALLLTVGSACAGASRVRSLPYDAGVEAHYAASREEVVAAVPGALRAAGQKLIEGPSPRSAVDTLIGLRGMNLLTHGEVSRVLVEDDAVNRSSVRVVSRSRNLLDWSNYAGRYALKIVAALDEEMGAPRLLPFEGMRVRGELADGRTVSGTVSRRPDGSFVLNSPTVGQDAVPLRSMTKLAAYRGSYGRGMEGAAVAGGIVGLLAVGQAIVRPALCGISAVCGGPTAALYAVPAGILLGYLVGESLRRHVWSPMQAPGSR